MPIYPPEQLKKLYQELPEDLKKAIFSKENAYNIRKICIEKGITDKDKISDAILNTGYVLIGLLPPDEFPKVLEKELELEVYVAEEIANEIKRFIFYPVRKNLEALYGISLLGKEEIDEKESSFDSSQKEKFSQIDSYREPMK